MPTFSVLIERQTVKRRKAIRKLLAGAYVGTQAAMTDKVVGDVEGSNMLSRISTLADSPSVTMQQALTLVDEIQEEANAALQSRRATAAAEDAKPPASGLN